MYLRTLPRQPFPNNPLDLVMTFVVALYWPFNIPDFLIVFENASTRLRNQLLN